MKSNMKTDNIISIVIPIFLALLFVEGVGNATQVNDKGEVVAWCGINVEKGKAISFDEYGHIKSSNSGYWRGVADKTYTLTFEDERGKKAILECTGEILFDEQGNITKGEKNFHRIMTEDKHGQWYNITSAELRDGVLSITAEMGEYTFFSKARIDSPTLRKNAKASVISGKLWKGQASFILNGCSPSFDNAGVISMDTRNYEVSIEYDNDFWNDSFFIIVSLLLQFGISLFFFLC